MRTIRLADLLNATQGTLLVERDNTFSGVGTDTRKSLNGQVFWALRGDSFDAHDFLLQAVQQGAKALVVERMPADPELQQKIKSHATVIQVSDSLKALQNFAKWHRSQSKALTIGITGSNGKTTCKEFAAATLSIKHKVHYSKGSFNNHWGLPFSILEQPAEAEIAVFELGMNHAREIENLVQIAAPDIVVCTMVGTAHIENFGTIEGIAKAKEEIYKFAPQKSVRVYNLDNIQTRRMYERANAEYPQAKAIFTFSAEEKKADVCFRISEMTSDFLKLSGHIHGVVSEQRVPVVGAQNLTNLLAAATISLAAGLEPKKIWEGLANCKTTWGRNQMLKTAKGAEIFFDAYNANPDSMAAMFSNVNLFKKSGRKIAMLAEMLELGDMAERFHRQVGNQAGAAGFDEIYFYGPHAAAFAAGVKDSGFSKKLVVTDSYQESLASSVASVLQDGDIVFVKGSRGMKLERFVTLCQPENFSINK